MEIIADKNLPIINKPLKSLRLPQGIIIGAIVHKSKVIIPHGESTVQAGDRIVVFSLLSKVPKLEAFFKLKDGR
jgi:trk system potassium uptake protein TrkA